MVQHPSSYKIMMDGEWSLQDFYELPHVITQVYGFLYHFSPGAEPRDEERVAFAFTSFPWRGGYSAVNFYTVLFQQVPHRVRPRVQSIQYASPGWIELALAVVVARAIASVVNTFVKSSSQLNSLYSEIYRGLQERKLLRIEVKRRSMQLAEEELQFIERSTNRIAKLLGFKNMSALRQYSDSPLATLKILLSYYRRVRTLAEYVRKGKASFPDEDR